MSTKTVLITGSSTGIGKVTALYFLEKGWNVAATMRTPEKSDLGSNSRLLAVALDVTKEESIKSAWAEITRKFGKIDVVVNNAGYGLTGPFEGATTEQIKRQFDTNVFGLMALCKEAISVWRTKKEKGILINITSVGGRVTFPYYSLYHSTKWAVEGFTESLNYEVAPLGIKVKLVEPGAIRTDFGGRSADHTDENAPREYQSILKIARDNIKKAVERSSEPIEVAKVIFQAATSNSSQLRYKAGSDAKLILALRKLVPENLFFSIIKSQVFKGAEI
ncbi:MAG: SDR family oxidoreductase [Acidobacteria bacterium]|nr:SDR family oxidoreductase [Acidobacteriota bacterium]